MFNFFDGNWSSFKSEPDLRSNPYENKKRSSRECYDNRTVKTASFDTLYLYLFCLVCLLVVI